MPRRELTSQKPQSVWDFMNEFEKAFEDFWTPTVPNGRAGESPFFTPAVDLQEKPDFYLICLDVPGVPQKDIRIDVQDGRLTISGERSKEETSEKGMFKRFERSYGRFERSFQLPQNADYDKIRARAENGVLEIMVPKAEQAKPKSIKIEEKGGLFSRLGKTLNGESTEVLPEKH